MKEYQRLGTTLLALFVVLTIWGCAVGQPRSIPPDRPQPVSSFSVEFVPAGAERYTPTDLKEVRLFKMLLHFPGTPDLIRRDERPARPYVRIGELRFGENWYYDTNIMELVNT